MLPLVLMGFTQVDFDIGRVTEVESDSGLYLAIKVEPVVEFTKLENVLVLINDSPAAKQYEESK